MPVPEYKYDPLVNCKFIEENHKKYLKTQLDTYCLGSAGSFMVGCRGCGFEHFRDAWDYFRNPSWFTCFEEACNYQELVPIRKSELESFWIPLWDSVSEGAQNASP